MDKVREIFESEVRDGIAKGACVLSGRTGGEPDYLMETGFADLNSSHPMTQDTVIDIASCTKAASLVTSLLILHSKGMIDFDTPFTKYLPEYRPVLKHRITIRDLANHRSGFSDVPGEKVRPYYDESGLKMLENIMLLPPPFPPTDHAVYSCWNYILLCRILENISGQRFPDFAEANIFRPLGMKDSSIGKPKKELPVSRLACTCGTTECGVISDFVAFRIFRDGGTTANAGMFSSAQDLAKLLKVYLRHGEGLFDEKSFAEIAPDKASHVDGCRRFGWVIWDDHLHEEAFGHALCHSGWSGQTILFDLKTDRYVIVLTTRHGDYDRCKKDRFEAIRLLDK